jgi:hypothetical protein
MPKKSKLTSSTDETSVGLLLSGDAIFTIPYFQRPYKWNPKRLQQLESDILNLVDGTTGGWPTSSLLHRTGCPTSRF